MQAQTAFHMAMSTVSRVNGLRNFKRFFHSYVDKVDTAAVDCMIEMNMQMLDRLKDYIRNDPSEDSQQKHIYINTLNRELEREGK